MVDNNISCELNKKRTTVTKDTIEGLKETIRNLYLADDIPWVIGYSGGKDSTATLQLVWLAIEELSAKQLKNAKKIQEYIQKQPEEDKAGERLTIGNY